MKLSILIVNYNSADFVAVSLYALKKLTKNPYQVFIRDNNSKLQDFLKLKKIAKKYDNVLLERMETSLTGSMAHGTALNALAKKVNTPYFSILDADAIWLKKNWDQTLIEKINNQVKVAGTQASGDKPKDFPLMFAILFETKTFKELNIDFRPQDLEKKQDTGWELREKYLNAGFGGKILKMKNTRKYKRGPFRGLVCAEYYLDGHDEVFSSHFGRGSTLGVNKYIRGNKTYFYRIPFIGGYFLKKKGKKEKKEWIKTCKLIIKSQSCGKEFENLKSCPHCASEKINVLLSAPNRLTSKEGTFFLSKCADCGLVFQNPRVKEKYISDYYTNELGYYRLPPRNKERKVFFSFIKKFVYHQTLINHYNYVNLGKQNIFLKTITPLFRRKKKIGLMPNFVKNGRLLEIGCSHGTRLEELKKIGWNVSGVEMDKKSAEFAQKEKALSVQNKKIEKLSFKKNSFDVVIMSMVLEHLYDPFGTLKRITSWLKPDGQLLFSIPYFEGFEFSVFKEYSYGLQLPTHITFFNKKILEAYLSKLGYKDIKFYFQYFDRDVVASAGYKYADTEKRFYKLISSSKIFRKLVIKPFVFILSLFEKTSRVSVLAFKAGTKKQGKTTCFFFAINKEQQGLLRFELQK
jgi:2-polyprenyl-3-methyl-5-hydroxy-6-metoxy-1,4-benzoquinol methylase